jgi:hypothetical protein
MPITWRPRGSRIDIVFSDPYTVQESEKVMKEIYADPRLRRPLRFLVDVRQSAPPDTDFVGNSITFWQLHVSDMRDARVAIVTATEGQDRMAHISERSAESRELPFTLGVFHGSQWADAERWLEETS